MSYRESLLYAHFNGTTAQTTIKGGLGVLHAVIINQVGATPVAITLSDGANTICVITPVANTTVAPLTAIYDLRFANNLVLSALASNTMDFTIVYE